MNRVTPSSTRPAPGPAQLLLTRRLWTMETEVDEGRRIPGYRRAAEEWRQIKPTPSGDSTLSGFSQE